MANFLSNIHWWLPAGIAVLGIILFAYANRRTDARLRSVGLAVIGAGVLLGAARFLIDTDQERAQRRTSEIVECASKQDWAGMQKLLDANTSLAMGGKGPVSSATGAQDIVTAAKSGADFIGLKSVSANSMKSEQTDTLIKVTFNALSVQEATQDRPYPSSWEFDWRQSSAGWYLQDIKLLSLASEAVNR